MRYAASEKLEIIRLVEDNRLSARLTLAKQGSPRTTFYRWYNRYLQRGEAAPKGEAFPPSIALKACCSSSDIRAPRQMRQLSAHAAPRTSVPRASHRIQPCCCSKASAARAFGLSRRGAVPIRTTSRTIFPVLPIPLTTTCAGLRRGRFPATRRLHRLSVTVGTATKPRATPDCTIRCMPSRRPNNVECPPPGRVRRMGLPIHRSLKTASVFCVFSEFMA